MNADYFMNIFGYTRVENSIRIFGSTAIKHWFPDYEKEPKDLDIITNNINLVKEQYPDAEVFYVDFYDKIMKYQKNLIYLDPDLLYTVKVSHMQWEGKNNKWFKHLKDIAYLKEKGCKLIPEIYDLFYEEWSVRFGDKSHISLNKATEMFFKDGVRREYDHDWLHEYFKIGDIPAYKRALKSLDSPMMAEETFSKLSKDEQIYCALEEMFVVAFERNITLTNAYKSLITKMTKGWFPKFMVMNAVEILDGYVDIKLDYINKVKQLKEKQNGISTST